MIPALHRPTLLVRTKAHGLYVGGTSLARAFTHRKGTFLWLFVIGFQVNFVLRRREWKKTCVCWMWVVQSHLTQVFPGSTTSLPPTWQSWRNRAGFVTAHAVPSETASGSWVGLYCSPLAVRLRAEIHFTWAQTLIPLLL